MASKFERAFTTRDGLDGQLPLPAIMDWLSAELLTLKELSSYLIFNPERYVRNRVYDGPMYQALVLCWRNGQRSPIHNHRGSHCGVRVLRAIPPPTLFPRQPHGPEPPVAPRDRAPGHTG